MRMMRMEVGWDEAEGDGASMLGSPGLLGVLGGHQAFLGLVVPPGP